MALVKGSRVGSYEIQELLGKGGMGEVYRVRDTKLERDVAIKTLPQEFTSDPDRLARFTREAKVLASLNQREERRGESNSSRQQRPDYLPFRHTRNRATQPRTVLATAGSRTTIWKIT